MSPSKASERLKEVNKTKRMAQTAAAESAKASEDRLKNRTDFDNHIIKQVRLAREQSFIQMKSWSIEFATDINHVDLCSSEDDAVKYFQKDGLPFTVRIVRMFLEYLVDSRRGRNIPRSSGFLHYSSIHGP
jgi:hypothetical protein